ncbi:hypothetical protein ACQBAR_00115 [Propionibacteriaceae bacterium Y1685]
MTSWSARGVVALLACLVVCAAIGLTTPDRGQDFAMTDDQVAVGAEGDVDGCRVHLVSAALAEALVPPGADPFDREAMLSGEPVLLVLVLEQQWTGPEAHPMELVLLDAQDREFAVEAAGSGVDLPAQAAGPGLRTRRTFVVRLTPELADGARLRIRREFAAGFTFFQRSAVLDLPATGDPVELITADPDTIEAPR